MSNQTFYRGTVSRTKHVEAILSELEEMKQTNKKTSDETKQAVDELVEEAHKAVDELLLEANKTIRQTVKTVIQELKINLDQTARNITTEVAIQAEKSVNKTARKAARRAAKRAARKAARKTVKVDQES
jgi:dsDNA-specific endonuclease/ATPase MutS2